MILVVLLVEPAEKSILEVEVGVAQEERVGMSGDVILVVQLVDEDVVDHRVLERRVGAGRIRANMSAAAEVRVNRGSTWMIFAPFSCALRIHLKAMGWFSATLLPSTRIVLQCLQVDPVIGHRPPSE